MQTPKKAIEVPAWQELTNYCEKHNQWYMRFLRTCPICVGEALADLPKAPLGPSSIPDEIIPNKTGLYCRDKEDRSMLKQPEQLSLFE
jgi:hypothetical protein